MKDDIYIVEYRKGEDHIIVGLFHDKHDAITATQKFSEEHDLTCDFIIAKVKTDTIITDGNWSDHLKQCEYGYWNFSDEGLI